LEQLQEAYDVQMRTLHAISGENIELRRQLAEKRQAILRFSEANIELRHRINELEAQLRNLRIIQQND